LIGVPVFVNLLRILLLAWMGVAGHCFAQQPYSFQDPGLKPAGESPAWMLQEDRQLRWRPQESEKEETGSSSGKPWSQKSDSFVPSTDYVDEPPGLPPGTYRRIEERQTITPYQDGFRFRPIGPSEQQGIKDRYREQKPQPNSSKRLQPRVQGWDGSGYNIEQRAPTPRFRPDARLDNGAGKAPRRYSYPQQPGSPLFRPE
jgi:hypothetical protein